VAHGSKEPSGLHRSPGLPLDEAGCDSQGAEPKTPLAAWAEPGPGAGGGSVLGGRLFRPARSSASGAHYRMTKSRLWAPFPTPIPPPTAVHLTLSCLRGSLESLTWVTRGNSSLPVSDDSVIPHAAPSPPSQTPGVWAAPRPPLPFSKPP
jgi:hypothetical protein